MRLGIRTPVVLPPMAGATNAKLAVRSFHNYLRLYAFKTIKCIDLPSPSSNIGTSNPWRRLCVHPCRSEVSQLGYTRQSVDLESVTYFHPASKGFDPADKLRSELSFIRSTFASTNNGNSLPIGVGFLGWRLEDPRGENESSAVELLDLALRSRVQAVWFSFGTQLGRWVRHVRDYDANNDNQHHRTRVFVQVGSYQEALQAIHEWKVDVLVTQGACFLRTFLR